MQDHKQVHAEPQDRSASFLLATCRSDASRSAPATHLFGKPRFRHLRTSQERFDAFECVAVMLLRRRTHVMMAVAEWIPKSLLCRWTFDVSKTQGPGRRGSEKHREGRTEDKEGFQTAQEGARRQAQTVVGDIDSQSERLWL